MKKIILIFLLVISIFFLKTQGVKAQGVFQCGNVYVLDPATGDPTKTTKPKIEPGQPITFKVIGANSYAGKPLYIGLYYYPESRFVQAGNGTVNINESGTGTAELFGGVITEPGDYVAYVFRTQPDEKTSTNDACGQNIVSFSIVGQPLPSPRGKEFQPTIIPCGNLSIFPIRTDGAGRARVPKDQPITFRITGAGDYANKQLNIVIFDESMQPNSLGGYQIVTVNNDGIATGTILGGITLLHDFSIAAYPSFVPAHLDLSLKKYNCSNLISFSVVEPIGEDRPNSLFCPAENGTTGIETAIGCIPINDFTSFINFIIKWSLGVAGGIGFLLILVAGFQIMTSRGDPDKLKGGQELLTSVVAGIVLLILSVFILRVIGVDVLKIPGFGK